MPRLAMAFNVALASRVLRARPAVPVSLAVPAEPLACSNLKCRRVR